MTMFAGLRRAVELAAARMQDAKNPGRIDAVAQAHGWTVERGSGGRRTYGDPMVSVYALRRRARIAAGGGDAIDNLLAVFDGGVSMSGAKAQEMASRSWPLCWVCKDIQVPRYGMCDQCRAAVGVLATEQARPGYRASFTAAR